MMSDLEAAVVMVGGVPAGHLTVAGHVAVKLPAPVNSFNIREHGPAGAVNVNVQLPVKVDRCLLDRVQLIVSDVPEFPLSVSVKYAVFAPKFTVVPITGLLIVGAVSVLFVRV